MSKLSKLTQAIEALIGYMDDDTHDDLQDVLEDCIDDGLSPSRTAQLVCIHLDISPILYEERIKEIVSTN